MRRRRLLTIGATAVVVWVLGTFAIVYLWPHVFYDQARRAVVERGMGIKPGGVPVNTLYATPALASPSLSKSAWVVTGNRDTLYTFGALDLGKGPQVLHVPDMGDRYYSIELIDPGLNIFADVGQRSAQDSARGGARDYLVSGPHWQGPAPAGLPRLVAPSDSILLLGRVMVEGDADLPTAHALAAQIQLAPLGGRQR